MSTDTPAVPDTVRAGRDERLTWRSLLWGSVIWFLHLNVAYGVASLSCRWGWLSAGALGLSGLVWVEGLLALLAAALLFVTIHLPYREWRQYQSTHPPENPQVLHEIEQDRRPFIAFVTMLVNSLYLMFALAVFALLAMLTPCA
jgi:hypothetical protein